MTDAETLAKLKEIVEKQSNMLVWADSYPSLGEHLFSLMCRHLHAVIEGDELTAQAAKKEYWHLDDEI